MSGPNSERWAGDRRPVLIASFPGPQNPDTDMPSYLYRFACSLIYGDRYFVYGHIYPYPLNVVRSSLVGASMFS